MNYAELEDLRNAALLAMSKQGMYDQAGCYRTVYFFTHRRRKYVVKLDKSTVANEDGCGGCESEINNWNKHRGLKAGSVMNPILAYGQISDGRYWLVQRKLRLITDVVREQDPGEYLDDNILPQLGDRAGDDVWNFRFGHDIHYNNVGMDNRGRWYLIDYATNWQ